MIMIAHSTTPLDTNTELQHILDYTLPRWEGTDKNTLTQIITEAFESGLKAAEIWFDKDTFNELWETIQNIRLNKKMWEKNSPDNAKDLLKLTNYHYDAIYMFGQNILMQSTMVEHAIMKEWHYEEHVNNAINSIIINHDINQKKLNPIGWDKLFENYEETDGFNEYAEHQHSIDKADFKGFISKSYYTLDYISLTALPYIMNQDYEQDRNATFGLISAVFSQGLFTKSHNNSVEMLKDFNNIINEISKPEYYKQIYQSIDFSNLCNSPQLKTICDIINNQNQHKDAPAEDFKELTNEALGKKSKNKSKTKNYYDIDYDEKYKKRDEQEHIILEKLLLKKTSKLKP